MNIYSRKAEEYLGRLERRLAHLENRILMSDKDLAYDKAEASALKWAIDTIKEMRNENTR